MKLVGLSSGALQEAEWFGRESIALMSPVCKPSFEDEFEIAALGGQSASQRFSDRGNRVISVSMRPLMSLRKIVSFRCMADMSTSSASGRSLNSAAISLRLFR